MSCRKEMIRIHGCQEIRRYDQGHLYTHGHTTTSRSLVVEKKKGKSLLFFLRKLH
ncbi:unnamed protein product, partial [Amoebophrya sp. A25]|eukprot:GSA25T00003074001.1